MAERDIQRWSTAPLMKQFLVWCKRYEFQFQTLCDDELSKGQNHGVASQQEGMETTGHVDPNYNA